MNHTIRLPVELICATKVERRRRGRFAGAFVSRRNRS
jgi:hypothetical protein